MSVEEMYEFIEALEVIAAVSHHLDPPHSRHFPYHRRPLPPHFGQIIIVSSMDISTREIAKGASGPWTMLGRAAVSFGTSSSGTRHASRKPVQSLMPAARAYRHRAAS
jgi:hypothetical protein